MLAAPSTAFALGEHRPVAPFLRHWILAQPPARQPTGRSLGSPPAGPRRMEARRRAPFLLIDDSYNQTSQTLGAGTGAGNASDSG
jgi:hypothetical protein